MLWVFRPPDRSALGVASAGGIRRQRGDVLASAAGLDAGRADAEGQHARGQQEAHGAHRHLPPEQDGQLRQVPGASGEHPAPAPGQLHLQRPFARSPRAWGPRHISGVHARQRGGCFKEGKGAASRALLAERASWSGRNPARPGEASIAGERGVPSRLTEGGFSIQVLWSEAEPDVRDSEVVNEGLLSCFLGRKGLRLVLLDDGEHVARGVLEPGN